MKLLVINGPNLNLLGLREPDIYGKANYASLVELIHDTCAGENIEVEVFQSNHEGIVSKAILKLPAGHGHFHELAAFPG